MTQNLILGGVNMSLSLTHEEIAGTSKKSLAVFKGIYETAHQERHDEEGYIRWLFRTLYILISFIIPVMGVCFVIMLRDDNPKEAKYPLIGTVASAMVYASFLVYITVEYIIFVRPPTAPIIHKIFPEFSSDFIIPFILP